jgi:hypothetical protein
LLAAAAVSAAIAVPALAIALDSDAPAPASAAAAGTKTREVRVEKVIIRHDGDGGTAAGPHVIVKSRSATGEADSATVRVIGMDDAAMTTIDASELAVGESRDLELGDDREGTIRRTESGLVLTLDGEEMEIPTGGDLKALGGESLTVLGGDHVKVISMSKLDGTDGHALVHALPPMLAMSGAELEDLESLKDLSPEVREATLAALKEILAKHHGAMAFAIDVDDADDVRVAPRAEARTKTRRNGLAPRAE